MPHSLVFNMLPRSPIPSGYLTGKHLHALFLTLVSSVDRELGDRLHEQKPQKAFTLSPVQHFEPSILNAKFNPNTANPKTQTSNLKTQNSKLSPHLKWDYHQAIPGDTPCWWRVSLLDDALFGHLSKLWLNLNPSKPWHLGPADLQITSVLGTPQSTQPWANYCSYGDLYEQASEGDRKIPFTLYTPATFRQGKYDSALPTRDCLFNSLLKRWNHYSQTPFEVTFDCLFPSFFDIRTEVVNNPEGRWAGCVGRIEYRILGDIDPTTIKQINTLADFALYAGVGRKTPMGMGIVRRNG